MDSSHSSIPPMRLEARFGDRLVPAFIARPASIWAMIAEAAARNPDGEAIICGERRLSWREAVAQSADIAAGFAKLGLVPGDRIAVLLGNRVEFVLTMFAAAHAGLVTVLLSVRQQKPEIAYVLTDCGAKILVHEAALEDRLPDARDVPELKHRVAVDDDAARSPFASLRGNASLPAPAKVGEEDTAMILYTSGTTGKPKGAMLAHCNVVHSSVVFVSCLKLTEADRSIAAVPLGHVTGVVANITTMARCAGALIIMPEFKAAEYLKLAARERVTYTVMVPAMYNLCLLQPDFDNYDLSSWRIGGFGGAPMPIATIEKLAAKIPGLQLANCYGATETTSPSTMMPAEFVASHIDSVGLPCPGATIIAVDGEGREVPRGEIGEIWIHGGSVIKGYWNNPKATAENFTGGFWHSGDLGSIAKRT
jgi:long-chain acyl-CoA synthetase